MFEAIGILWGNLLWQCAAFLVLIFLLYRLAYKPVLRMLDERANRIRESMEQAEQIKIANQEAAKRAEQIIAEAQQQTREILAQANQISQRTIAAAQAEAREQRDRLVADARAQIEADVQRAKEELQSEVARLAIMVATKVVGRSLDSQDHLRLVDEALREVETQRGAATGTGRA